MRAPPEWQQGLEGRAAPFLRAVCPVQTSVQTATQGPDLSQEPWVGAEFSTILTGGNGGPPPRPRLSCLWRNCSPLFPAAAPLQGVYLRYLEGLVHL